MQITYYGHSCFKVNINGKDLLFDPFISANPLASMVEVAQISTDYLFISHAHDDHTADALDIAKQTGCTCVGIWEIYSWFLKNGIENAHPMNIGGSWNFDFGKVKMVPAMHSSSFSDGTYGGQPAGFVVSTETEAFYYAGDTAFFSDMKLLAEKFKFKAAFLPIGSNFTMDIDEAVEASKAIHCDTIIGMHFDTFGFIKIDKQEAITKFTAAGKNLILMDIGSTIEL